MVSLAVIEVAPTPGYLTSNVALDDVVIRATDALQNIHLIGGSAPRVTLSNGTTAVYGALTADSVSAPNITWLSNNTSNLATAAALAFTNASVATNTTNISWLSNNDSNLATVTALNTVSATATWASNNATLGSGGGAPITWARYTRSNAQSVASGNIVTLLWDTKTDDTGVGLSNQSGVFVNTSGSNGLFQFSFHLLYPTNGTGNRQIWMQTGSNFSTSSKRWGHQCFLAGAGTDIAMSSTCIMSIPAGSNVCACVYQTSGGALTLGGSNAYLDSGYNAHIQILRIG